MKGKSFLYNSMSTSPRYRSELNPFLKDFLESLIQTSYLWFKCMNPSM